MKRKLRYYKEYERKVTVNRTTIYSVAASIAEEVYNRVSIMTGKFEVLDLSGKKLSSNDINEDIEVIITPVGIVPLTDKEIVREWFEDAKKDGSTEINLYCSTFSDIYRDITEKVANSPYVILKGTDEIYEYIDNGAIRDCEELLKYRGTYNPLIS